MLAEYDYNSHYENWFLLEIAWDGHVANCCQFKHTSFLENAWINIVEKNDFNNQICILIFVLDQFLDAWVLAHFCMHNM